MCVACAGLSAAGVWTLAPMLRRFDAAQEHQTELLNKVLRRIPAMTTFETVVTNRAGHEIEVSVTCREGESVEDCFDRFEQAVKLAAASTT